MKPEIKHEALIKEMRESIGIKDPIVFFGKLTDVLSLLFDRINSLELSLDKVKRQSTLAIQWEPKVAQDFLALQIEALRKDKELYFNELSLLKKAYTEDLVTQNYKDFVDFWINTLGFHPFLDYKD